MVSTLKTRPPQIRGELSQQFVSVPMKDKAQGKAAAVRPRLRPEYISIKARLMPKCWLWGPCQNFGLETRRSHIFCLSADFRSRLKSRLMPRPLLQDQGCCQSFGLEAKPRSKFWLANISQICGLEVEARTQGWGQGQYYGTWVEVNIFTWRTRPKFCPWGQWSLNFGLGQKAGKLRSWLRLVLQSQSWGLDFNLKAMPRQMASRLNSLA